MRSSYKKILVALLVCICIGVVIYFIIPGQPAQAANENTQITGDLLTVRTAKDVPANLIHYKAIDVNFNPDKHVPNWVAWELTAEETRGGTPRGNKFRVDPSVPGCPTLADYKNSGYDRGHMAPAADMKFDPEAMAECFFLTNMCPQAHSLNAGAWRNVEEKCRTWSLADGRVIIVCGPVMDEKGLGTIGMTKVYVPEKFFKVILSPDAKPEPRAIGFIMNNGRVEGGMEKSVVTVDSVESLTGHDFFSALPDDIENKVEATSDLMLWPKTAN